MAIQNNINAAIGTVGSAIAVGQHLSEQKTANMDKAIEMKAATDKAIQEFNQDEINLPTEKMKGDINQLKNEVELAEYEKGELNDKLDELNKKRDEAFLATGKDNFGYKMAVEKNIKKQEGINANIARMNQSRLTLENEIQARRLQRAQLEMQMQAVNKRMKKAQFAPIKGGKE